MMRVEIKPELLRWARERAKFDVKALVHRFPKLADWEEGTAQPTLKQVESFAKATYTPVGFFFLPKPPVERIPIPDFRSGRAVRSENPSPDLLDTVYICQQRQEWYRDYARSVRDEPRPFVGSVNTRSDIEETAATIRRTLGFDLEERRQLPTWTEALRLFIELADASGILVMCSGVVLNNNRRHLNPDEFLGFAMADTLAPVIFINGADFKAAQMFTLAHELAHIWLGKSGVSNSNAGSVPKDEVEQWCNCVAAELLVPHKILREDYKKGAELSTELGRLARRFKVSTLVILRRIHDVGGLTKDQFWEAYHKELEQLRDLPPRSGGGNFYLTQAARVSKRFARALVVSTLEGRSSFTEAFRLLGFKKMATFRELGHRLGVGL